MKQFYTILFCIFFGCFNLFCQSKYNIGIGGGIGFENNQTNFNYDFEIYREILKDFSIGVNYTFSDNSVNNYNISRYSLFGEWLNQSKSKTNFSAIMGISLMDFNQIRNETVVAFDLAIKLKYLLNSNSSLNIKVLNSFNKVNNDYVQFNILYIFKL